MNSDWLRCFSRRMLFMAFVIITGCATSPYQADAKARSDALLADQIKQAQSLIAKSSEPRIIYAGFAMHSQSKAFRNDVLSGTRLAEQLDANAVVFKLNNPAFGQEADWPFATTENIQAVLTQIGSMAREQDKIVLLFSTHGNVGLMAVNAANNNLPSMSAQNLRTWLTPLRGKPTALILSACYSGSFVEPLREPNRIILTAAAKDRSSFGCQFHSDNTYFVEELIGKTINTSLSIRQLAEQAELGVDKREKAMKLSPSSLPQRFFGLAALDWSNQPLASWRNYRFVAEKGPAAD